MKKYLFALTAFIFTAMVTTSSHSALINIERYEHKNVGKAVGCPDGYLMSKPQGKLCTTMKVKGISCYKDCYCDGSKGYVKVAGTDSCKCKDGWEQKGDGTCEKITCTKDEDLIGGKCVSCSTFPRIDCPSDRGTYRRSEKCGKCRYTECKKGYTLSSGDCICSGAGSRMVEGKGCVCDTTAGWNGTPPNCVAKSCPTGYSTDITGCADDEVKDSSGKSGGKSCNKCVKKACEETCSATEFTVAEKDKDPNANYKECKLTCSEGSRYKFEACKEGYETKDGKCVAKACKETCSTTEYPLTDEDIRKNADLNAEYDTCKLTCSEGSRYKFRSCKEGYELVDGTCQHIEDTTGHQCCVGGTFLFGEYREGVGHSECRILGDNGIRRYKYDNHFDGYCVGSAENIDQLKELTGYPKYERYGNCSGINGSAKGHIHITIGNSIDAPEENLSFKDGEHSLIGSGRAETDTYPVITVNEFSLEEGAIVALDIKAQKVTLKNVSVERSIIETNELYLEGSSAKTLASYNNQITFNNVTIIAKKVYIKDAPNIVFYQMGTEMNYGAWNGFQYSGGEPYSILRKVPNTWGSYDKPVAFHKIGDKESALIMLTTYVQDQILADGVTIYGYNAEKDPIFAELVLPTPYSIYYAERKDYLPTFRYYDTRSYDPVPLFRKVQTYGAFDSFTSKVDIGTLSTPDKGCEAIKNTAYFRVGESEECSLGSASEYVTCSGLSSLCKDLKCSDFGLVSSLQYLYMAYSADDPDMQNLFKNAGVTLTPVATACDTEDNWTPCYRVEVDEAKSVNSCLDDGSEETCSDGVNTLLGDVMAEGSTVHTACAEVPASEDYRATCSGMFEKYYPDENFDETVSFAVNYKNNIDGSQNTDGKKCLVCQYKTSDTYMPQGCQETGSNPTYKSTCTEDFERIAFRHASDTNAITDAPGYVCADVYVGRLDTKEEMAAEYERVCRQHLYASADYNGIDREKIKVSYFSHNYKYKDDRCVICTYSRTE